PRDQVLQEVGRADGRDEDGCHLLAAQASQDDAVEEEARGRSDRDRGEDAEQRPPACARSDPERHVRAEHVEVGVRNVEHAEDAENEGEAEADECVRAAEGEAVHDDLDDVGHRSRPRYAALRRGSSATSPTEPPVSIRPRSITCAYSAIRSASSESCSTSTTVIARVSSTSRRASKMLFTTFGASPMLGSSTRRMAGSISSARPIVSICCSPPE